MCLSALPQTTHNSREQKNDVLVANQRDDGVVRASSSQSVDQGFITKVQSYQKTFKNGIHSFPAWRSA